MAAFRNPGRRTTRSRSALTETRARTSVSEDKTEGKRRKGEKELDTWGHSNVSSFFVTFKLFTSVTPV